MFRNSSDASLAESGAIGFKASTERGLKLAREAGLEFIDISEDERARWQEVIDATMQEVLAESVGSMTIGDVMNKMKGM